jgi:hypothetical protein
MCNEVIIIGADDWEGLFVNGKLVDEGHTLNEGASRKKYLSEICSKYSVTLDDIAEGYVTKEYEEYMYDSGGFHESLSAVGYTLND